MVLSEETVLLREDRTKMDSSLTVRRHKCNYCYKSFKSSSHLKDHLRLHTGERPFQCPICLSKFTQRSNMKQHIRHRHAPDKNNCQTRRGRRLVQCDNRPYPCGICGTSFTKTSHLKDHMRLHTGERPFCCKICSKAFVQKSHMKSHLKTHSPSHSNKYRYDLYQDQRNVVNHTDTQWNGTSHEIHTEKSPSQDKDDLDYSSPPELNQSSVYDSSEESLLRRNPPRGARSKTHIREQESDSDNDSYDHDKTTSDKTGYEPENNDHNQHNGEQSNSREKRSNDNDNREHNGDCNADHNGVFREEVLEQSHTSFDPHDNVLKDYRFVGQPELHNEFEHVMPHQTRSLITSTHSAEKSSGEYKKRKGMNEDNGAGWKVKGKKKKKKNRVKSGNARKSGNDIGDANDSLEAYERSNPTSQADQDYSQNTSPTYPMDVQKSYSAVGHRSDRVSGQTLQNINGAQPGMNISHTQDVPQSDIGVTLSSNRSESENAIQNTYVQKPLPHKGVYYHLPHLPALIPSSRSSMPDTEPNGISSPHLHADVPQNYTHTGPQLRSYGSMHNNTKQQEHATLTVPSASQAQSNLGMFQDSPMICNHLTIEFLPPQEEPHTSSPSNQSQILRWSRRVGESRATVEHNIRSPDRQNADDLPIGEEILVRRQSTEDPYNPRVLAFRNVHNNNNCCSGVNNNEHYSEEYLQHRRTSVDSPVIPSNHKNDYHNTIACSNSQVAPGYNKPERSAVVVGGVNIKTEREAHITSEITAEYEKRHSVEYSSHHEQCNRAEDMSDGRYNGGVPVERNTLPVERIGYRAYNRIPVIHEKIPSNKGSARYSQQSQNDDRTQELPYLLASNQQPKNPRSYSNITHIQTNGNLVDKRCPDSKTGKTQMEKELSIYQRDVSEYQNRGVPSSMRKAEEPNFPSYYRTSDNSTTSRRIVYSSEQDISTLGGTQRKIPPQRRSIGNICETYAMQMDRIFQNSREHIRDIVSSPEEGHPRAVSISVQSNVPIQNTASKNIQISYAAETQTNTNSYTAVSQMNTVHTGKDHSSFRNRPSLERKPGSSPQHQYPTGYTDSNNLVTHTYSNADLNTEYTSQASPGVMNTPYSSAYEKVKSSNIPQEQLLPKYRIKRARVIQNHNNTGQPNRPDNISPKNSLIGNSQDRGNHSQAPVLIEQRCVTSTAANAFIDSYSHIYSRHLANYQPPPRSKGVPTSNSPNEVLFVPSSNTVFPGRFIDLRNKTGPHKSFVVQSADRPKAFTIAVDVETQTSPCGNTNTAQIGWSNTAVDNNKNKNVSNQLRIYQRPRASHEVRRNTCDVSLQTEERCFNGYSTPVVSYNRKRNYVNKEVNNQVENNYIDTRDYPSNQLSDPNTVHHNRLRRFAYSNEAHNYGNIDHREQTLNQVSADNSTIPPIPADVDSEFVIESGDVYPTIGHVWSLRGDSVNVSS